MISVDEALAKSKQKEKLLERLEVLCGSKSGSQAVSVYGSLDSTIMILDCMPGYVMKDSVAVVDTNTYTMRCLSRLLSDIGVSYHDCAVSYLYHCRTKCKQCRSWLGRELSIYTNISTIICLGTEVTKEFIPEFTMDAYGKTYRIEIGSNSYIIVPIIHPWSLRYRPEMLEPTSDLLRRVLT